jgi:hypothetical protein
MKKVLQYVSLVLGWLSFGGALYNVVKVEFSIMSLLFIILGFSIITLSYISILDSKENE